MINLDYLQHSVNSAFYFVSDGRHACGYVEQESRREFVAIDLDGVVLGTFCDIQSVTRLPTIRGAAVTPTASSAESFRDRSWWRHESRRRVIAMKDPRDNMSDTDRAAWGESAREYQADRGHRANVAWDLDREGDREEIARLRRLIADPKISLEGLLGEFARERGTPQSTVESIMMAVRERGVAALSEPDIAERLERCDAAAREQINRRIAKLTGGDTDG
jgi:hypothetical protein